MVKTVQQEQALQQSDMQHRSLQTCANISIRTEKSEANSIRKTLYRYCCKPGD